MFLLSPSHSQAAAVLGQEGALDKQYFNVYFNELIVFLLYDTVFIQSQQSNGQLGCVKKCRVLKWRPAIVYESTHCYMQVN